MPASKWRLEFTAGSQLRLRRGVTLVGRDPTCDIVLHNSKVSRRQLLIHARRDAVELVKLGRQTVCCDALTLAEAAVVVGDGARISIGGTHFAELCALSKADDPPRWLARVDRSPALTLPREGFVVGGGATDELRIEGWPPAALRLHPIDAGVIVERSPEVHDLLHTDERSRFDGDGFARVDPERPLRIMKRVLSVLLVSATATTRTCTNTVLGNTKTLVRLESFGRGGVITVERGDEVSSAYLSRLRFSLVHALIRPRASATAGGYVDLETMSAEIWPNDAFKTEYDFNVLLHRVRQDLIRAGLGADEFIERARGSGRLRSPIAANATVILADL